MNTGHAVAPIYFLQWHITHRCNLRCAHCYQDDYETFTPSDELIRTLDDFEAFLREKGRTGQINLTGGEPLLHPDFWDLAAEIRRRRIRLGILTNGTLINAETAVCLAKLQPVFVQISLDGNRKVHDAIRGEGSFDKAINALRLLRKTGTRVLISFTAQQQNIRSFPALTRLCYRENVNRLWWDRVVTDDPSQYLTTRQFSRMVKKADRLRKKTMYADDRPMIGNNRSLQFPASGGECSYQCSAGKDLLVILANGDLMPCRRLPFIIGNLRDGPLTEILKNSRLMSELAESDIPDECRECPYAKCCRGGGRCVTYAQTGRLNAKDVNCFLSCR